MKSNHKKENRTVNRAGPPTPTSLGHDLGLMSGLTLLTLILISAIFPPTELWPLAFLGLAPWTFAICRVSRPWVAHWGSFFFGWLFFLWNLKWLMPVTGLGYAALAFYLALYWTLSAWAIRTGRRAGVAPVWSLPVVWVGCEFLRAWMITGFPWLFIAHAFHKQLAFIQISDTIGAYGVTFIVVLVNGALAQWLLAWKPPPAEHAGRINAWIGTLAACAALVANLLYGNFRLNEANFKDGPRVAVIQEDFPLLSVPPYSAPVYQIFAHYFALAGEAAHEQPDLIVFPETVWGATQNISFIESAAQSPDERGALKWQYGKFCEDATAAFARGDYAAVNQVISYFERALNGSLERGEKKYELPRLPAEGGPPVTLVVGSVAVDICPEEVSDREKRYNSVLVYDRDGRQRRERYDKIHRVPFGEFVPFRNARICGIDFHWLYRWLNRLSPFSEGGKIDYSLWRGAHYTAFPYEFAGKTLHFGAPICYEDTMPYVARRLVWDGGRRRADFLLNVSNDGWFLHSEELPQHLAICVFRAVENRVGIARAVNTGISGFIEPSGRLYSLMEGPDGLYGPGVVGYRIAPVKIDGRKSCYGRLGDWFAWLCFTGTCVLWGGAIVTRWVFALQKRYRSWRARRRGAKHAESA